MDTQLWSMLNLQKQKQQHSAGSIMLPGLLWAELLPQSVMGDLLGLEILQAAREAKSGRSG
jgi:hypothetical protein